jgi:hypothetical protein
MDEWVASENKITQVDAQRPLQSYTFPTRSIQAVNKQAVLKKWRLWRQD